MKEPMMQALLEEKLKAEDPTGDETDSGGFTDRAEVVRSCNSAFPRKFESS
jgi:hypothetical protein